MIVKYIPLHLMFVIVDGRRRTPENGYTISSPMSQGSCELIMVSSFESNENTLRQSVGHIAQFRIMNPHQ